MYQKTTKGWPAGPERAGYINLECFREDHTAPANTNAVDTLIAPTPAGAQRPVRQRAVESCGVTPPAGSDEPRQPMVQILLARLAR